MFFFEKFLENFIFHYTRAQDAHDAEIRIRKAPKPSEHNFQEVSHILDTFWKRLSKSVTETRRDSLVCQPP